MAKGLVCCCSIPVSSLELEAQEEPGSYSPVLCHVSHNFGYGPFHERTMLQLKTSLCFLPVALSGRSSQTVRTPSSQEALHRFHYQFISTYSGTNISPHFRSCFLDHSLLRYFYGGGSCLLFPPSYPGLAFQSSFLNDAQFTSDLFPPPAPVWINPKVCMDNQKELQY